MQEYKRSFIVVTIILVQSFLILAGRLWYLQVLRGDEFERFSLNNRIRVVRVPAPRGRILDRQGREIIANRPSFDVYVLPKDIRDLGFLTDTLSTVLGLDVKNITSKIQAALKQDRFKPVLIAQDINRDQLALIEARKGSLPSVIIEVNHTRKYPHGKLGASFLGYLGKATESDLELYPGIRGDDMVGKSGVEKSWEAYLQGKHGFIQKVTDALGREVRWDFFEQDLKSRDSVQGADVVLSIDLDLQKAAEEALGDRSGAVVVVDVRTGGVLALVSHPTFNPSDFIRGIDAKKWKELIADPSFPLLNRATQGLYAPGSVFKIVTAAAGLKEGVIDSHSGFYCPGRYRLGSKTFRCWKPAGHGWVNLRQAIVKSCDVYFYNVVAKLGIDRFATYIKDFGFGALTGIDIEERPGISPSREWKLKTYKEQWYEGETISMGIGQGYVNSTPLQIALMTSAVANGGKLLKPQMVKKVVSPMGETLVENHPQVNHTLSVNQTILDLIRDGLVGVVNDPSGTGRNARLDEMTVAGKTGTAQVVGLGKGNHERFKDHAWFTSYAPAENPEVAITVMVENGGKGGAVAAPVVKQILEVYLKLKAEGNV
ncbi:MAG TPA: penicillin-binding protein 2 [Thermodesulfobacteriota bacterium]|nr:penicillin-binding protein 2 [Thermodesulfobacteriota bacterium]